MSAPNHNRLSISKARDIYDTLQSWAQVLVSLILVFTFIGRVSIVDGVSMMPTLLHGDVVLVRSIGYTPTNGDIVVLSPATPQQELMVKRVIARGGQTIVIDGGTVTVDGEVLEEPYLNELSVDQGIEISLTVPDGCIFVLGDNRDMSVDSRIIGAVDERLVIGQVVAVLYPFTQMRLL